MRKAKIVMQAAVHQKSKEVNQEKEQTKTIDKIKEVQLQRRQTAKEINLDLIQQKESVQ